ncbi:unnamed protein product [Pieris brassicae]|uniref:Uncharacterized protein n=1 Tax=Pieris brassicae TaxID=7116 RepID=A0A9P0TG69_PIEBR|nr:unnamed protein product [Pieris brassicae]
MQSCSKPLNCRDTLKEKVSVRKHDYGSHSAVVGVRITFRSYFPIRNIALDAEAKSISIDNSSVGGGCGRRALPLSATVDEHYLLDKIDTSEQVHPKVDEGPCDALFLVLLLFEDKHMMIKELLQPLVREVNAELLETIILYGQYDRSDNRHE